MNNSMRATILTAGLVQRLSVSQIFEAESKKRLNAPALDLLDACTIGAESKIKQTIRFGKSGCLANPIGICVADSVITSANAL